MKRNSAIKKVSVYLNKTYNEVYKLLKRLKAGDTQYNLVLSSNLNIISSGIICRDWETYLNYQYFYIKDSIVLAYPFIFIGRDKKVTNGNNVVKKFNKTSFKINEDLIVLKKTITNNIHTDFKDVITYTIYVYKFNINEMGKLPKDIFDYEKQCNFSMKNIKRIKG